LVDELGRGRGGDGDLKERGWELRFGPAGKEEWITQTRDYRAQGEQGPRKASSGWGKEMKRNKAYRGLWLFKKAARQEKPWRKRS